MTFNLIVVVSPAAESPVADPAPPQLNVRARIAVSELPVPGASVAQTITAIPVEALEEGRNGAAPLW